MDHLVKVNNLSKQYYRKSNQDSFMALKDISFNIDSGEVVGIIGRNGAGKSTLLKILSEIVSPSSGTVTFNGTVASILDIGTGFHPDLSGYENIYLNASFLGMKKKDIDNKINNIIQFSEIGDFIHEPISSYSNGMYLRLAFSIAINVSPQVLLLDEVIAVGDREFRMKCNSKIRELAAKGVAIVLVSHNMQQVLEFCSRCIWIDSGTIQLDGKAMDVIERYVSREYINQNSGEEQLVGPKRIDRKIAEFTVIHSIEMVNEVGEALTSTSSPILFKILCEKLVSEDSLEISIYLMNLDGIRIFLDSFALRPDYSNNIICEIGKYWVECTIPPFLLNRGIYHLSIVITRSCEVIGELENVFVFKVFPTSTNGVDHNFSKMNTLVAPRLNWVVTPLSETNN